MSAALRRWIGVSLLAVVGLAGPGLAGLQGQASPGSRPTFASPFLPVDHWAQDALRRVFGLGLLGTGYDPSVTSITRRQAMDLLYDAAREARDRRPALLPLIEGYRSRLEEEFPHTARALRAEPVPAGVGVGNSATFGFEARRDGLLARHLEPADGTRRPTSLDDLNEPAGRLETAVQLYPDAPVLAAYGALRRQDGEWTASEAYATLAGEGIGVWAGRRRLELGPGESGAIVLSGTLPHNGAGLYTPGGFRLPAFLRYLGRWNVEAFISRLDRAGEIESPWFFGLRTSLAPHPRVRIGVNRAAMFAGENNEVDATPGRVLKVLAGIDTSEDGEPGNFENQVASIDFWILPPLGPVPLALYGEWAVEDLSENRFELPALLAGARLAGLPGLPEASLGVEWTEFPSSPNSNRPWYQHRAFDTWTEEGRLLGHPLGGEGHEWRVYGGADAMDARLRLRGDVFTRDRGGDNLFAPDRRGDSVGLAGRIQVRLNRHLDLLLAGATEEGDGDWRESEGFAGVRAIF